MFFENGVFTYGQYQFFVPGKLISKFGIPLYSAQELYSLFPRPGIFSTFWGPAFMDFGIFTIIYSIILGLLSKYFYIKLKQKSITGIIMYPIFGIVLLGIAFFNFFQSYYFYYLYASIITVLLLKNKFNS